MEEQSDNNGDEGEGMHDSDEYESAIIASCETPHDKSPSHQKETHVKHMRRDAVTSLALTEAFTFAKSECHVLRAR
jgi:hypothetical protein